MALTNRQARKLIYAVIETNKDKYNDDTLEALEMGRTALEQEPCDNAISREDVIKLIQCSEYELQDRVDNDAMCDDIRDLPPVTQKLGHWIHFAQSDDCSECGWSTGKYISPSKYCPNCGVRMVEPQEKSVNNLCDSCTNIRCEFQSGIVRTKCTFYIPPHIKITGK